MAADTSLGFAARQLAHLESIETKLNFIIAEQRDANEAIASMYNAMQLVEDEPREDSYPSFSDSFEVEQSDAIVIREEWLSKHRERKARAV